MQFLKLKTSFIGSHCAYSSQSPKCLASSECRNLMIDCKVALMNLQTIIHRSILYSIFKEKMCCMVHDLRFFKRPIVQSNYLLRTFKQSNNIQLIFNCSQIDTPDIDSSVTGDRYCASSALISVSPSSLVAGWTWKGGRSFWIVFPEHS